MQYLIYSKDQPALVVISISSDGMPQLSNREDLAMQFHEQDGAEEFICEYLDLTCSGQFWGTRPVRKPK